MLEMEHPFSQKLTFLRASAPLRELLFSGQITVSEGMMASFGMTTIPSRIK
jgi:hypothetical protein